jgi:hypothetical protein
MKMDYGALLTAASRGYTMWAMKPHNKRWAKKLDGTPIPNDLLVCVCQEIAEQLNDQQERKP